jgi:glucosamine kinase
MFFFPETETSVESDLLAAAHATLGNKSGIACILGTGSNSCLYNGKEITAHVPPLGFILGDEGSGAVLGRS